ncbi:Flagellar assembly protein FliH [Buchnera aphidicola (Anoecia corni)]|uniref:Flagellar assembly protein FliH n=1 Tax=Buchnera aphidicola (Anoecia corni) TaxID=2994477 RepID=A0AAT9IGQ9_9GAMM
MKQSKSKKWKIWKPKKIKQNNDFYINKKNQNLSSLNILETSKVNSTNVQDLKNKKIQLNENNKIYKSGFENGKKKGFKIAYETEKKIFEKKQKINEEKINSLLNNLKLSFEKLDNQVSSKLLNIIINISVKILGKKPVLDTSCLFKKIQNLVNQELQEYKNLQFHVHENDFKFIKKKFENAINKNGWKILKNKYLSPGECQITSNTGDFYISANKSWKTLYEKIINEEKNESTFKKMD